MSWCIYKHTSPTGKCYIGKAVEPAEQRWGKNGKNYNKGKFGVAILLYGWDNFTHEILESKILTNNEAIEREKYWVDYYNSCLNGYNMLLNKTQWFYYLIETPYAYGMTSEQFLRYFCAKDTTGEKWDAKIQKNFDEQVDNILNFNMKLLSAHKYGLTWGEIFKLSYAELPNYLNIRFENPSIPTEEDFNQVKNEGLKKYQELEDWKRKYLNKEFIWQL